MVGTVEIGAAIASALKNFQGQIIVDPVLTSTSGLPLYEEKRHQPFKENLFTMATAITPNKDELQILTGQTINSADQALASACYLLAQYQNLQAIVVKGGHLNQDNPRVDNYLIEPSPDTKEPIITKISHPRVQTKNSHGTGCTFASALTAFHAQTNNYKQSFKKANHFTHQLLNNSAPLDLGKQTGGLAHHTFRD